MDRLHVEVGVLGIGVFQDLGGTLEHLTVELGETFVAVHEDGRVRVGGEG